MPNKMMIKDGEIIANPWQIVTTAESFNELSAEALQQPLIVSHALWQTHSDQLSQHSSLGLWLSNDQALEVIANDIQHFSVIAIDFPIFMDGRAFSLARLLRERYSYNGELRATGALIRDQLSYLKRCGFNSFDLDDSIDINEALKSLNDFTEFYQSACDQDQPLFRRRA